MEVERKHERKKIEFYSVKPGDIFELNDRLYMAIASSDGRNNIIDIRDGQPSTLEGKSIFVYKVNGRFVEE